MNPPYPMPTPKDGEKQNPYLVYPPDNPYPYSSSPTAAPLHPNLPDSVPPPYYNPPYNNPQQPMTNMNMNIGYQPQLHQSNSTADTVMAAQAVNAAIHQNGRQAISVVCPTCKTLVMTEITEVDVPTIAQAQSKIMYIFFGGTLLVFIAFFIIVTIVSESYIPLAIMPVFLIFITVGFCMMRFAGKTAASLCKDIQHRCSSCKTFLGVSSGQQYAQQMQMANNRYRHHHGRL